MGMKEGALVGETEGDFVGATEGELVGVPEGELVGAVVFCIVAINSPKTLSRLGIALSILSLSLWGALLVSAFRAAYHVTYDSATSSRSGWSLA